VGLARTAVRPLQKYRAKTLTAKRLRTAGVAHQNQPQRMNNGPTSRSRAYRTRAACLQHTTRGRRRSVRSATAEGIVMEAATRITTAAAEAGEDVAVRGDANTCRADRPRR
jgi:hypothetical protein